MKVDYPTNRHSLDLPAIQALLDEIRERMMRAEAWRSQAKGNPISAEERLLDVAANKPTSLGRSEGRITAQQVSDMTEQVEILRQWLFAHGQDGTRSSEYKNRLRWGEWSTAGARNSYWYAGKHFALYADQSALLSDSPVPRQLLLTASFKREADIMVSFGFGSDLFPYDNVELNINFHDRTRDDRIAVHYDTSRIPLERLTPEEGALIMYYLYWFEQQTAQR